MKQHPNSGYWALYITVRSKALLLDNVDRGHGG